MTNKIKTLTMQTKDLYNTPYRIGTNVDLIAISIFFLLLIASFNGGMGNDEGMWNYIGRVWTNGIPPYTGAVDGKPPGIFMLFAISNVLFGVNFWFPRILGILAMVITSMLIYLIGRQLYNPLAGTFAMIMFGLTMAWELMDGAYAAQIESFMILFIALAFYSLIKSQSAKESRAYIISVFTSGFSMGIAISFKQIAIFSAVALFLFFLNLDSRTNKNIWRDSLILFAGTIFSIYISLIPLLLSGVTIADYWRGAWLILVEEGSRQGAMNTSIGSRIVEFFHIWRYSEMILFYPLVLLFIIQKKRIRDNNIPFFGIIFWVIWDFLAVNASGNYYGHQLKQLIPSLALASGIAISTYFQENWFKAPNKRKQTVQIIVIIGVLWFPYDTFSKTLYTKIIVPYIKNIRPSYNEPLAKQLGTWIKENTESEDYVLVWTDNLNQTLAYSERKSPSRYFNPLYANTQSAKQELTNDVLNKPPKFILTSSNKGAIPEIEGIINEFYKYKFSKSTYDIFERIGKNQMLSSMSPKTLHH